MLLVSGNLLEGTLPDVVNPKLAFFDLSGVVGRSGGLKGPLPPNSMPSVGASDIDNSQSADGR